MSVQADFEWPCCSCAMASGGFRRQVPCCAHAAPAGVLTSLASDFGVLPRARLWLALVRALDADTLQVLVSESPPFLKLLQSVSLAVRKQGTVFTSWSRGRLSPVCAHPGTYFAHLICLTIIDVEESAVWVRGEASRVTHFPIAAVAVVSW